MADANTSLPIRTQANGDVVAFLADGTTSTQLLAIDSTGRIVTKLNDAAGNGLTSQVSGAQQALDVGINVAGVQVDPRAIRALTSADVVTVDQGTSPWVMNLTQVGGATIALGQAAMSASIPVVISSNQTAIPVSQSGTWSVGLTLDDNYGTVGTNTLRTAAQIGNGTGAADFGAGTTGAQTLRTAANIYDGAGNAITSGIQGSARALDVELQINGAVASSANPIPVSVSSVTPGTPVQDYHTSVALAKAASVTFTYTVAAGHTFVLNRIWSTASGKIKTIVSIGATTIFAGFNSTATPNIDMTVMAPPTVAAAGTVNVTITNEDTAAMDVYATIEGNQN